MPCDSGYLRPTNREAQLQRTAQVYEYALRQLGQTVPPPVHEAAQDIYGNQRDYVPALCTLLNSLTKEQREHMLYGNARDPMARKLADWWDEHQKADKAREKAVRRQIRDLRADAARALKEADALEIGLKK